MTGKVEVAAVLQEYEGALTLASARDRLAESRLLCECDVIFEVVRTRSVHEGGYGHNRVRSAA